MLEPTPDDIQTVPPMAASVAAPAPKSVPWGPWASLGLAAVVLVVGVGIQLALAMGQVVVQGHHRAHFDYAGAMSALASNGLYISLVECFTLPLCGGLICLFAALRRIRPREYLALMPVQWQTIALWMVVVIAFNITTDYATFLLHRPVVPEFMSSVYRSAGCYPLMWLALVGAGPLFEELLFRGFLFRGLAQAKTGIPGAIFITSLLWASLHTQYDFYGIAQVFAMGLLFGFVRARTGSLYPNLAMHAAANAQAIIEAAYVVGHGMAGKG